MTKLSIRESAHATALKQVWLHEEPDTVVEDRSCVNPITGCALPTDIVNHRKRIAIEVQSEFHDVEQQKTKDAIKKKFWIESGYDFYAIDHRDYTILEMIQIFFKHIVDVPEYIDFDDKFISVVQLDLNKNFIKEYKTIQLAECCSLCSAGAIRKALRDGFNYSGGYYWVLKDDYYSGNYSITECRTENFMQPIMQLNLDGSLVKKYSTAKDASECTGINYGSIISAMNRDSNFTNGFLWISEFNYTSGNYCKTNFKFIGVVQLDLSKNFVCEYETIELAECTIGCNESGIRNALKAGRNYCYGFYWVLKDDYYSGDYNIVETILKSVVQLDERGLFVAEYKSIAEASRTTKINEYTIRKCKKNHCICNEGYYWIDKNSYLSGCHNISA